ncbi:methyltransferase domain-containing protein [Streptomyces parvulus]|uniref:SAM-dependent methyltransferase n=1 Tax=Streptomyces TaxID=1883 RepID=UPI001CFA2B12|nr:MULTISPECIES: class I SAM-dependent methyltransferase [Streptomyces]MCC9152670.1 methyltransferase domain-containing protein [Streptomyces parvulus]MCE7687182.1 methyltransferase domain-containing protein [Streptomyces parvulus]WHM34518.1 class I SAM-dependent methyltransferase [Streptomyces sp. BPPL-273]
MSNKVEPVESVEVSDASVQREWKSVAATGARELASSYVLCNTVLGLARSGIAARLSDHWTPLAELVPPGGYTELVGNLLRFAEIRGLVESRGDSWRLSASGGALLGEVPEAVIGYYAEAYGPVLSSIEGLATGRLRYGTDVERDTEALGRRCEVLFRSVGMNVVRELIGRYGAERVLDLGCGTGGMVLDLAREDPRLRAVGLDIAEDAVALASKRAREEGLQDRVSFVVGDAFVPGEWPAAARECDLFIAVGAVHEHFRDGEEAVAELLRAYAELLAGKPGSVLVLAEPELFRDAEDADFFLVHALTEQGFPQRREPWLKVIEAAGLTCRRIQSVPDTMFRFAYYEITSAAVPR